MTRAAAADALLPAGRRRGCTRSRSARCMPASSSPDISASPASGETVVRLEERLGYVHKGIEALMARRRRSTSAAQTCRPHLRRQHGRLCARVRRAPSKRRSASSCRRARSGCAALMAELERLANHLGDIGAICNDAAFALMHAHCGVLREQVLRAAAACFRPPADDGPRRARRRRGQISTAGTGARSARLIDTIRARFPDAGRALRQHRLAAGPHRRHRHPVARAGAAVRRRRLCRPRVGPRFRCAQRCRAIRPTTRCASTCRCWPRATSMPASGSASARSSRAWR